MKQGKIIKGIAGFYYVFVVGSGIYECKAKGIFRKQNRKPLVGDAVTIEVISEEEMTGNVTELLPRKNALVRPAVANVDQALVIFAAAAPEPNLNLLDRFLLMMEQQGVPTLIGFNKADLVTRERILELTEAYATSTYPCLFFSAGREQDVSEVRRLLAGKTTTLAGPSGVGKSTLINLLSQKEQMETGAVSERIGRGRHTTRHSELLYLGEDTFIFDTPGFSSLASDFFEPETLWSLFPEFVPYEPACRFAGCSHINEPDCGIKVAVAEGQISRSRYENYVQIYQELKDKKKY